MSLSWKKIIGGGRGGKGMELKCVGYMYQSPTVNVIIICWKRINNNKSKGNKVSGNFYRKRLIDMLDVTLSLFSVIQDSTCYRKLSRPNAYWVIKLSMENSLGMFEEDRKAISAVHLSG